MSEATVYPNGMGQDVEARICHFRWGGGADFGKWHVFVSYSRGYIDNGPCLPVISMQCVVDNFGNLREVKQ